MPSQRTITSVKLTDLFPATDCDCTADPVEAAIAAGHVRRQFHLTEPLAILNYTEVCAYENAWTPVTLGCRGLIYRTDTGEVVARPYAKFFNYGQAGAPELDLEGPAHVADKADGSLGILHPLPSGGWAIATRGSFASEQAIHATELFNREYAWRFTPRPGQTVLFEIVYPENRIVLDYAGLDDLILLGAVETATGAVLDPTWVSDWPGPVTDVFAASTLAEALAMEPRPNAEGVVVRMLDTGAMVKIKQADYVALHKIVTGLTARVVWQHLIDGKPLADLIAPLPDEFHGWVREVATGIADSTAAELDRLTAAFWKLTEQMPDGWDPADRAGRKDFAMVAAQSPDRWAFFNLLDGKDIRPELLKRAKPEPYLTPSGRTYTEDTA
jgi:RNA ligase